MIMKKTVLRYEWRMILILATLTLGACGNNGDNIPGNQPPTADAGADQNVPTAATVQLDGSASSDPESDPLTYSWSLTTPAGSTASLSDPNIVNPTFVADVDGDYVATLVVNDGTSDSAPDSATITATTEVHYYLSLGTSLSVGVQPDSVGLPGLTNQGYADQLFAIIKPSFDAAGPPTRELQLVKLGCPGETLDKMTNGGICPYIEGSQLDAAVAFLTANKGNVHLVTIDMGGNDFRDGGCIDTTVDLTCANLVSAQISTDLAAVLATLRNASGPDTTIVGMNYYNPYLASWLQDASGQTLAVESAQAAGILTDFLGTTYATEGMPLADVAAAFESDNFVTMVSSSLPPPNDVLPVNVANICLLTYMCDPSPVGPDIHANAAGYGLIADTFAAVLP